MKGYIEERAIKTAEYIIETKATVRQTARKFGVSKSTVHKDVTTRLTDLLQEKNIFMNRNSSKKKKSFLMNTGKTDS